MVRHATFPKRNLAPTSSKPSFNSSLSSFEIRGWFQKSLDGIFKLVQQQLDSSLRENKPVQVRIYIVQGVTSDKSDAMLFIESDTGWRFLAVPHCEACLESVFGSKNSSFVSTRWVRTESTALSLII
jgi:hypothetical protein